MILTKRQQEGLQIALDRYRNGEKYTCIAGFAGTGKSTLVRFVIEALDIPVEGIRYVAFTGKASEVLRKKGNPNAITAHKLLYQAKQKTDGTYFFEPREELEGSPQIIVVDEVSMLPKDMWDQLCRHPVYILALGDPF